MLQQKQNAIGGAIEAPVIEEQPAENVCHIHKRNLELICIDCKKLQRAAKREFAISAQCLVNISSTTLEWRKTFTTRSTLDLNAMLIGNVPNIGASLL